MPSVNEGDLTFADQEIGVQMFVVGDDGCWPLRPRLRKALPRGREIHPHGRFEFDNKNNSENEKANWFCPKVEVKCHILRVSLISQSSCSQSFIRTLRAPHCIILVWEISHHVKWACGLVV